jgi:phage shock protein C
MWLVIPLGPSIYVEIPCKKLYRSRVHRKLSGICGGLGEYFKIDPLVIRILFVILMLTTFIVPMLISYLIGTVIIPENLDQI